MHAIEETILRIYESLVQRARGDIVVRTKRVNWWLRAVASSTNFCNVNNNGNANNNDASNLESWIGVRTYWCFVVVDVVFHHALQFKHKITKWEIEFSVHSFAQKLVKIAYHYGVVFPFTYIQIES